MRPTSVYLLVTMRATRLHSLRFASIDFKDLFCTGGRRPLLNPVVRARIVLSRLVPALS